jgi:hypothetical protein
VTALGFGRRLWIRFIYFFLSSIGRPQTFSSPTCLLATSLRSYPLWRLLWYHQTFDRSRWCRRRGYRLEENPFPLQVLFSSLLLGLLVGCFYQFSNLGLKYSLVITIWGEDVVTKSKTDTFIIILLWNFFYSVILFVIFRFLRNLVAITYSAIRGRSKDLHEEIVLYMESGFPMGALLASVYSGLWRLFFGPRGHQVCTCIPSWLYCWALFLAQNHNHVIYHKCQAYPSSSRSMMAV